MTPADEAVWISRSCGKINLGLQILNRLPTGYHEIATGFCFINWSDRFEVTKAPSFRLSMSDDRLPADSSNLIIRALNKLRRYADFDDSWSVYVDKVLPFGAGLGGGSSNAATMLRMINKLSGLGLKTGDIQSFVSGLGADIPVFLHGKTAIGTGIGVQLDFQDIQPGAWILTVFPDIHVSTADAYQHCTPNPEPEFQLEHILLNEPLEEWRYLLFNDLEPWAIHQHPMIGNIKDQMYELGADYAAMSGSGSSVFGLFRQEFVAVDAYNRFIDWDLQANLTPPSFQPDFGIYQTM
ncbi:4-(cytidine 5'-diphospho)-2-C-methyl-D-erythritol kinase [Natronogracilivirga saccharolytica]|uniref:4-diphosphocytidyl-2-C-methyl-D-erythritol kinase n=1 Tax=Natronogracilivirga saccharolytica TaxID=2812953 RepID=A0A8J7UUK1_9BACT|nr:4-(cytidine 5'-diphospho)-2-C-methyl-D-erythritol kinase [Natronogracilivirga saccharolytica]